MARIRSVHPGIWTDEAFVQLSPLARLALIGIWNEADDQGIFQWKPATLKMRLLPNDNLSFADLLGELQAADKIRHYDADGKSYGAVRNFQKFQRPKKPTRVHPANDEIQHYLGGGGWEPNDHADGVIKPVPSAPVTNCFPTSLVLMREVSATVSESVSQILEVGPQMEEEGGRRERKEDPALGADAGSMPSVVKALWQDGLTTLARIVDQDLGSARKLMGKLVEIAGGQHQRLHALIRKAETEVPDNAIAWLCARAQAMHPDGAGLGADAVSSKQRTAGGWWRDHPALGTDEVDGRIVPTISGYSVELATALVAEAARIPEGWRGDWSALGEWLAADIPPSRAAEAIRRVALREGYNASAVRSLRYFDSAVREQKVAP